MSDDQEWKPKIRPQSTMAQDFSTALDSAFSLDSNVDFLSQTIDQKKQKMMIQNRELEELQARIRAAEERLKARASRMVSGNHRPNEQKDAGYQSTESASATTSPTDTAGQYSSGDERQQGRNS
ncbi:hypothetical protein BDV18DRAFT_145059 [Aspergillus unguis]